MSAYIYENIVYYLLDIYHFLEVIHKHNCNEISFGWYNHLVFMKNACKTKMIETKSGVIGEKIEKHNITMKKIIVVFWYRNTMDRK